MFVKLVNCKFSHYLMRLKEFIELFLSILSYLMNYSYLMEVIIRVLDITK